MDDSDDLIRLLLASVLRRRGLLAGHALPLPTRHLHPVQRILADLDGPRANARRASGEREKESRPAKEDTIAGEVKPAPRTDDALGGEPVLGE